MVDQFLTVTCPACLLELSPEKSKSIPYASSDYFKNIIFCPRCQVGIAYPQMKDSEIDKIYEEGGYWQDREAKIFLPQSYPGLYSNALARWRFCQSFCKDIKDFSILDIGAGHGFFGAAVAKDKQLVLSYDIVEKDKYYCQSLQTTWKELYPKVQFNIYQDFSQTKGQYDLVVLSHVLEHINNPLRMLDAVKSRLKSGGMMFIDVPCGDFRFKRNVFPHINFFTLQSIEQMAGELKMSVLISGCYGTDWKKAKAYWYSRNAWHWIEDLVYRFRQILPLQLSLAFYERLWQATKENREGVWIRALLKRS